MSAVAKPNGGDLRQALWTFAVAATVVWASGHSNVAAPGGIIGLDKFAHFSVFGLLATHVLRCGWVWRRGAARAWLAIAAVSLFGLTDEWHQSFTPGRSVEWEDWIADTSGAALAVFFYLKWPFYRRLLESPLWPARRAAPSLPEPAQA